MFRTVCTAALLVALVVPACDDDPIIYDHTWKVSYRVANATSVDLTVRPAGAAFDKPFSILPGEFAVPAGQTVEMRQYTEFLGAPPDARRRFSCFSAYRTSDDALVFQRNVVSNNQWVFREHRNRYDVSYTMEISDDDLDMNGMECTCVRVVGLITSGGNGEPLSGAPIFVFTEYPAPNRTAIADDFGEYEIKFSNEPPQGDIYFEALNHEQAKFALPGALTEIGHILYRLDVTLAVSDTLSQ